MEGGISTYTSFSFEADSFGVDALDTFSFFFFLEDAFGLVSLSFINRRYREEKT